MFLRILVLLSLFFVPHFAMAATGGAGIAAVVNSEVVTITDLNQRMTLIMSSSGMPNTEEVRARLKNQVLTNLVEESLRLQEAKRLKIEVTPEEVTAAFDAVAKQNNIPPEQFRELVKRNMGGTKPLEDQIKAQISWTKVIAKEIRPRVNITENDQNAELAKLKAKLGKPQYQIAEIFLPIDGKNDEARVSEAATRISTQLQQNPTLFPKVANQFSQSSTAANGGMVGWVTDEQLPEGLVGILGAMQKGAVSSAVKTTTGYTIVQLLDTRMVDETTLPTADQVMERLGIQRIDLLQRRYMQDLKSQAFIDIRI